MAASDETKADPAWVNLDVERSRGFQDDLERADRRKHFSTLLIVHMHASLGSDIREVQRKLQRCPPPDAVAEALVVAQLRVLARAHAEGVDVGRFKCLEGLYEGLA